MDEQFSLSWNNFHGNLSKGFSGLLGKGEFVDVTLAVEGHLLQAHKVILSICSPYFKKMFQLNPCQHPIVVLRDVSHKAMSDLLRFMYHGEVSVKREDFLSLIKTAELLEIKGLTNKETETDNESTNAEKETHKKCVDVNSDDSSSFTKPEQTESPQNELNPSKHEALQRRIIALKRKTDEMQKSYFASELFNVDKRPKLQESPSYIKYAERKQRNNNFDQFQNQFDDSPIDATTNYKAQISDDQISSVHDNVSLSEHALEPDIEIKPECEDMTLNDASCTTPKEYDEPRQSPKDLVDYQQAAQDNCSSLSMLFMDLKNLVNGKVAYDMSRVKPQDEYPVNVMQHRLGTIPQKEDGKKKYPQRSCRLCWKIGKRRDTRFMCTACEMPFCKTPCFDKHFDNILKSSQLQHEYFAS